MPKAVKKTNKKSGKPPKPKDPGSASNASDISSDDPTSMFELKMEEKILLELKLKNLHLSIKNLSEYKKVIWSQREVIKERHQIIENKCNLLKSDIIGIKTGKTFVCNTSSMEKSNIKLLQPKKDPHSIPPIKNEPTKVEGQNSKKKINILEPVEPQSNVSVTPSTPRPASPESDSEDNQRPILTSLLVQQLKVKIKSYIEEEICASINLINIERITKLESIIKHMAVPVHSTKVVRVHIIGCEELLVRGVDAPDLPKAPNHRKRYYTAHYKKQSSKAPHAEQHQTVIIDNENNKKNFPYVVLSPSNERSSAVSRNSTFYLGTVADYVINEAFELISLKPFIITPLNGDVVLTTEILEALKPIIKQTVIHNSRYGMTPTIDVIAESKLKFFENQITKDLPTLIEKAICNNTHKNIKKSIEERESLRNNNFVCQNSQNTQNTQNIIDLTGPVGQDSIVQDALGNIVETEVSKLIKNFNDSNRNNTSPVSNPPVPLSIRYAGLQVNKRPRDQDGNEVSPTPNKLLKSLVFPAVGSSTLAESVKAEPVVSKVEVKASTSSDAVANNHQKSLKCAVSVDLTSDTTDCKNNIQIKREKNNFSKPPKKQSPPETSPLEPLSTESSQISSLETPVEMMIPIIVQTTSLAVGGKKNLIKISPSQLPSNANLHKISSSSITKHQVLMGSDTSTTEAPNFSRSFERKLQTIPLTVRNSEILDADSDSENKQNNSSTLASFEVDDDLIFINDD